MLIQKNRLNVLCNSYGIKASSFKNNTKYIKVKEVKKKKK